MAGAVQSNVLKWKNHVGLLVANRVESNVEFLIGRFISFDEFGITCTFRYNFRV